MVSIGELAGRTMLRIALRMARIESRSVVTPNGVAGAGKTVADTQGETICRVRNALDVEGTPDRSGEPPATGTRPTRGLRI